MKRRRRIVLDISPGADVVIDDSAVLGEGCRIHAHGGVVRIGARAVLGERCVLIAHAGIDIGEGAVLADEVVAIDFEHAHDDVEMPVRLQPLVARPIVVGPGARIGVGAALRPGARVPGGTTVAPRTVRA